MRKAKYKYKLKSVEEVFGREADKGLVFNLTSYACKELAKAAKQMRTTESIIVEGLIESGLDVAVEYYKNAGFSPEQSKRTKSIVRYGENKKVKTLVISNFASGELDKYASLIGESRSEILECAIRSPAIAAAQKKLQELLG